MMECSSIGVLEADVGQYLSHRACAPVLSGCGGAHLCGTTGVRPSPGAATFAWSGVFELFTMLGKSVLLRPGTGALRPKQAWAVVVPACSARGGGFPHFQLAIMGGIEYDAPVELIRHPRVQYGY